MGLGVARYLAGGWVLTLAEALRDYGVQAGPKRAAIVRKFIDEQGWHPEPDAASRALERHLRSLRQAGLRPSSVDQVYRTVRAFYRRYGLMAPRVPGQRYDPRDSSRPALSREVIERLVQAARQGLVPPLYTAYLALSTVYGLRAGEIASLRPEDLDRQGKRIYVRTLKGGVSRWIWLPEEVSRWLLDPWPGPAPVARVEAAFGRVWDATMESIRPARVAWHSIRRALHRDLASAGVSREARERFGRWASRTREMASLYAYPNATVTETGVQVAQREAEGTREEDREVWERHPYLCLWN
jgi:integrase